MIHSFLSHPSSKGDKADLIAKHLAAPAGALSYSMDFKCFRLITLSISFVLSRKRWKTSGYDWASCILLFSFVSAKNPRSIFLVSLENIAAFVFTNLIALRCRGWAVGAFGCLKPNNLVLLTDLFPSTTDGCKALETGKVQRWFYWGVRCCGWMGIGREFSVDAQSTSVCCCTWSPVLFPCRQNTHIRRTATQIRKSRLFFCYYYSSSTRDVLCSVPGISQS